MPDAGPVAERGSAPAPAPAPPLPGSAVVRPAEAETAAGIRYRGSRRTGRRIAAVLALTSLIVAVVTVFGLVRPKISEINDAAPGMRLASPEEAAIGASERLGPDNGSITGEQLTADGASTDDPGPAGEAVPSPDSVQYPAPLVAEEPVVAVAEALSPSVVLVEVETDTAFGFGLGSGIVWDAQNGYIVTNQHVVEGSDGVTITLSDGTSLTGEVVGGSVGHDVAVVRVDPEAAELVAATFAPVSSVRVGQLAVAIGSPLGLTGTVTAGIVSAVRIQVQGGADPGSPVPVEMIQTDAAINRGNSGGALADWQGRVVGMNTMIQTTSGANIGLGFAVPSDTVELIATRIVEGESLELGYLGISGYASGKDDPGVVVAEVLPGSPAENAGLLAGDIIVSLDAEPMDDITQLSAAIKLRRPGETVELAVRRDGDVYITTAVLDPLG